MTDNEIKTSGCEVADNLLSAYIDEELSETESQFVQKHVSTCEICPKVLEDMEETINALAGLPKEAIPEHDLWDDIFARYDGPDVVNLAHARSQKNRRFGFSRGQLAAAAVALLMIPGAFAGGLMLGLNSDDHGGESVVSVVPRATDRRPEPRPAPRPEPVIVTPRPPTAPAVPSPPRAPRPSAQPRAGRSAERAAVLAGLIRALQDSDADVRKSAVMAIGDMDNAEQAVPALIQTLQNDSNGEVRRWAAYGLGEIGDVRAIVPLMIALQSDGFSEARRWSAYALSEMGDERSVGALINALHDSNAEVRRWSAYALGEIGSSAAAGPLTEALEDSNPEVRRWAAWALAEIADNF